MVAAEVAARCRADVERHLDALAAVEVGALADRTQVHRAGPHVFRQQRRVALETAAGKHDLAVKGDAPRPLLVCGKTDDRAACVLQQASRGRVVEEIDTELLGARGQRIDERRATAHGQQAGLRLGQELGRQEVELHAQPLQPRNRRRHMVGKIADHLRIRHGKRSRHVRPVVAAPGRHLVGQVRIDIQPDIGGQVGLEIVCHLVHRLHAQVGLGVTALPAPIVTAGALKHGH